SAELVRRAGGHVAATAHIWRALVPELAARGVEDWSALGAWLGAAPRPARPKKRTYPLPPALRRALPSRPGVYRFVRKNRDVLYVGKAASLKARVASHFSGHARATERALEMLTQVADIDYTETESVLEAALLECDEIKRLDPPYNIHLRSQERATWYASRDLREVVTQPDAAHRQGPLSSRFGAAPLAALVELVGDAQAAPRWRALALGVPNAFLPNDALFHEGFAQFCSDYLIGPGGAQRQLLRAARALWLSRGRSEEPGPEDAPPDSWDLARVRRRLERNLIQAGLALRRARWLRLLADADIVYRESGMEQARALHVRRGALDQRSSHASLADALSQSSAAPRSAAPCLIDIGTYDRLRVLATELRRVLDEGGEVGVRLARRVLTGERLLRLTREL
ncbi:MAG TPA: GIY-YIG nuclease family protein, partial [Polyangiales bacterium]